MLLCSDSSAFNGPGLKIKFALSTIKGIHSYATQLCIQFKTEVMKTNENQKSFKIQDDDYTWRIRSLEPTNVFLVFRPEHKVLSQ